MEKENKFKEIESNWQKFWAAYAEATAAKDYSNKPKKYILVEFPYPSGSGLHIGHAFTFTGGDVYARYWRMRGFNVLYPMGWDAFGLPTENYAIKMKKPPQEVTKQNTDMFREQMKRLAFSFDWSREVNTTDPDYYRWTQWIFIQLFKKGLAYKQEMPINWCPSCKIGLANEEVVNGKCERCGAEVSRRNISQWVVKITNYADRLLEGLEQTNFVEKVKQAQINWIGKSEGARIKFKLESGSATILSCSRQRRAGTLLSDMKSDSDDCARKIGHSPDFNIEVFTTRPDTLYGATFMVIAPEHDLVNQIMNKQIPNSPPKADQLMADKSQTNSNVQIINAQIEEIKKYVANARKKSDMERTELAKEKTGVFSGLYAINPVNGKEIPIWISDFVLASYGTGAIMAVPAHDERDFAFAKKFGLPIVPTYAKATAGEAGNWNYQDEACTDLTGVIAINSPRWNGLVPSEAIKVAIKWVKEEGIGEPTANYHLRDWIFSRQHYWGEPIPMIFCKNCAENHGNNQVPNSNNQTITNNQNLNDQNERIKTYAKENNIDIEVPKKNPGWYPVPEEELPIVLPEVEHYEPTDTGESPLSMMADWVKAKCPVCGGEARRETDTMPNWAGSDWYYLGYLCNLGSSKFQFSNSKQVQNPNDKNLNKSNSFRDSDLEIRDSQNIFTLNEDILKYWMPVDVYIGGDEHNTLHLLYSRFIYQFLYDLGCVPTPEPYSRRMSHGVILGPDNQRMSKSRGNVIVPDQVADKYGVDVARMYLMFMGPFTGTMAWNEKTLMGVKRFLDRFNQFILDVIARNEETKQSKDGDRHSASWRIAMTKEGGKEDIQIKAIINKLIDGVTRDIEEFGYNTAIAKMMEAINQLRITNYELRKDDIKTLIKLIAPLAPYTAEELWSKVREEKDSISVHIADWPVAEKAMLVEEEITIPVAVNGKVRDQLSINQLRITNGKEIIEEAKGLEKIKQWLVGKQVVKEIYVPGKMINLVVR